KIANRAAVAAPAAAPRLRHLLEATIIGAGYRLYSWFPPVSRPGSSSSGMERRSTCGRSRPKTSRSSMRRSPRCPSALCISGSSRPSSGCRTRWPTASGAASTRSRSRCPRSLDRHAAHRVRGCFPPACRDARSGHGGRDQDALAHGRRSVALTTSGIALALVIWVTATAVGLSALLRTSGEVLFVLKIIGASYLGYLGVRTLLESRRRPADRLAGMPPAPPAPAHAVCRQGFLSAL